VVQFTISLSVLNPQRAEALRNPPLCSPQNVTLPPFSTTWLSDAKAYIFNAETEQGSSHFDFATKGNQFEYIFFKNNATFASDYRLLVADENSHITVSGVSTTDTQIQVTTTTGSASKFRWAPFGTNTASFQLQADYGVGGTTSASPYTSTSIACIEFASNDVTVSSSFYGTVSRVFPYNQEQSFLGTQGTFALCAKYCTSTTQTQTVNLQALGLTDAQLRATALPISGTVTTGGLTDAQLRATPLPISGTVTTSGGTTSTAPTTVLLNKTQIEKGIALFITCVIAGWFVLGFKVRFKK